MSRCMQCICVNQLTYQDILGLENWRILTMKDAQALEKLVCKLLHLQFTKVVLSDVLLQGAVTQLKSKVHV